MMRDEIKNKINFKKHQIKKIEIKKMRIKFKKKYKLKDTTEFLKALHKY